MRANRVAVSFLLAMLMGSGFAYGVEPLMGQGEGLADNLVMSNSSASMLANVPTGGIKPGAWKFETGYSRMYNLSDFDQFFLATAYRRGKIVLAGEAASFGKSELYSELTGKLMVSYMIDSLSIGVSGSGRLLQFGYGYENLSVAAFGVGVSYRQDRYFLAVAGDNLNGPEYIESSPPVETVWSVYGEYLSKRSFSILAHLRAEAEQATRFGFGQRISLADKGAFVWGFQTEPFKYGAGFELGMLGGRLAYSFSVHPTLGFSHTISILSGTGLGTTGAGHEFK